jgi:Cu(I)/Ag(I) efflux system membrane fusion protein
MNARQVFFALTALAAGVALGWGGALWRAGVAPGHGAGEGAVAQPAAPAASAERKVLYWYDPMSPVQKFD